MAWPVSKLISKILTSVITPKEGYRVLFAKEDGWYDKDDTGVETKVSNDSGGGLGYDVYTARITQNGTDAPVVTVLGDNTIGNIVWTYEDVGYYVGTLTNAFPVGRTWFTIIQDGQKLIGLDHDTSDDSVYIGLAGHDGTDSDSFSGSLEIRVYPE